jgi:hypothetical protein
LLDCSSIGVIAVANAIKNMGGLSKLIFGGDRYYDDKRGESITPEPAVLEVGMSEADFSNRNLGAGGAIIIAAWIIHKDRGALTKLDISSNNIAAAQGEDLQRICAASGIEIELAK